MCSGRKLQINKITDHKSHTLKFGNDATDRRKYFVSLFLFLTAGKLMRCKISLSTRMQEKPSETILQLKS